MKKCTNSGRENGSKLASRVECGNTLPLPIFINAPVPAARNPVPMLPWPSPTTAQRLARDQSAKAALSNVLTQRDAVGLRDVLSAFYGLFEILEVRRRELKA